MADIVDVSEQRQRSGGVCWRFPRAAGSWGHRDPGMVGPRFRHQGDGGPARHGRFEALAPACHGELAGHTEMDKAGELINALPADRAGRNMSGAVDFLADHQATTDNGIGVVGFCMGGMLTFVLAALRPDKVKAAVPFYGFPQGDDQPDYSKIEASIQGHMAEHDDFFPPSAAMHLEEELKALGKDVAIHGAPRHRPRLHGAAQRARHPEPGEARRDLAAGDGIPPRRTGLIAVS